MQIGPSSYYYQAQPRDDKRVREALRDLAMRGPVVEPVPPGGFVRWMKLRRKLGGQNKVPRIVTDEDLFADIRAVVLRHELTENTDAS